MGKRWPGRPERAPGKVTFKRRPLSLAAAGLLVVAFSAGVSAAAAPTALARTTASVGASGGERAPAATASLPADVQRVCGWPPPPGQASCLVLRRTDVRGHIGLFRAGAAPQAYGPADLRSAYNLPDDSGQNETIALVDAFDDPNAASDLAVYRSQYGLPPCTTADGCFRKVNQEGQESNYPAPDAGWGLEESLDVDMASAICPRCHILLVEASDQTLTDLGESVDTAVRLGATFVSNSYGFPEKDASAAFEKYYTHPGVAITAAAGDNGYTAGVIAPAGFPQVVAVGGTSLEKAGNPRGWAEIVWTGTGSGCSAYTRPAWQSGTGCANRMDNDTAAVADPGTGVAVYDSYGKGGWNVVGGTSVASPLIASVYALAGRPAGGSNPASYLYLQDSDAAGSGFNDIIAGTNDLQGNCSPVRWCNGEPGYDGPTGWGTPDGVGAFETPVDYVAMGDSYSSGEGNPPYYSGSNTRNDKCHRSVSGYPTMITWPGQPLPIARQASDGGNDRFTFIACSGAETTGVTDDAVFNGAPPEATWNKDHNTDWDEAQDIAEAPQATASHLSSRTTLVTITIGGNDIRFSDVLYGCLILAPRAKTHCSSANYTLIRRSTGAKDPAPLRDFEPMVIDHLTAHLVKTYEAIHGLAPNAEMIVAGYPLLFPLNTTSSCTVGTLGPKKFTLNADDQNWLNDMGTELNQAILNAVSQVSGKSFVIRFVNPAPAFTGHALCSAQPWLYGLKLLSGGSIVNPGSFHPNQSGQRAYATLINGCLADPATC